MTIPDDPEISPSESNLPVSYATAPPASDDVEIHVNVTPVASIAAESPPIAVATATAIPVPMDVVQSSPPSIYRKILQDGSLEIRVTSTSYEMSPANNENYRRVKTEFYHVPASLAGSIPAANSIPSELYLTRVEEQLLPPDTGEVLTRPPNQTVAAATLQPGMAAYPGQNNINDLQQQQINNYFQQNTAVNSSSSSSRKWLPCLAFVVIFVIIFIIVGGVSNHNTNSMSDTSSNSWFDDDFFHNGHNNNNNWPYPLNNNPTSSPAPSKPPVPTTSPQPTSKYTNPPWLSPYTLPPYLFAPTSPPEPTTSPVPTTKYDYGEFTLPPYLKSLTFPPNYYKKETDSEEKE